MPCRRQSLIRAAHSHLEAREEKYRWVHWVRLGVLGARDVRLCAAAGNRRNPLYGIELYEPTSRTCRDDWRFMTCSTSIACVVLAAVARRR